MEETGRQMTDRSIVREAYTRPTSATSDMIKIKKNTVGPKSSDPSRVVLHEYNGGPERRKSHKVGRI